MLDLYQVLYAHSFQLELHFGHHSQAYESLGISQFVSIFMVLSGSDHWSTFFGGTTFAGQRLLLKNLQDKSF
ncbi:13151_t:CDS:2, partial [Racocetra persica]